MNKIVAVHDGKFHTDEVIAVWLIRRLYPIELVRTRDQNTLDQADFVVDVGGIYDPDANKFDHHQDDFDLTFTGTVTKSTDIPLSSAGLVWKKYGLRIIEQCCQDWNIDLPLDQHLEAYHILYQMIFKEIDANDNGIPQYSSNSDRNYNTNLTLIGTIAKMNYSQDIYNNDKQLQQFYQALDLCTSIMKYQITYYLEKIAMYPSDQAKIQELIRQYYCPGQHVFVADERITNLKKCLKETGVWNNLTFIIQPSDNKWTVMCVSDAQSQFKNKKDILPLEVLHFFEPALANEIIFVHSKRFLCVTSTKQAAIRVAELSLTPLHTKFTDKWCLDLSQISHIYRCHGIDWNIEAHSHFLPISDIKNILEAGQHSHRQQKILKITQKKSEFQFDVYNKTGQRNTIITANLVRDFELNKLF